MPRRKLTPIEKARKVREQRAVWLKALDDRTIYFDDLFRDFGHLPYCLRGCTINRLLLAVRTMGEVKVRQVLKDADVDHDRKVGTLTKEERRRIIEQLPDSARKAIP